MSSSGRGQSVLKSAADIEAAWKNSQEGARGGAGRVIVEGFIDFEYEITLLTLRHVGGTSFLDPVGHRQVDGDYHESWQPQRMTPLALQRAQDIAFKITDNLGGRGIFGVELFVSGDDVWFSEVSPRPHDTGMVTMISQNLSEFACHARAIFGFPIPKIRQYGPCASAVILGHGTSQAPAFENVAAAMAEDDTEVRLFGKPDIDGERRLGVALAMGTTIEERAQKGMRGCCAYQVRSRII